jgi:hypothetical protein
MERQAECWTTAPDSKPGELNGLVSSSLTLSAEDAQSDRLTEPALKPGELNRLAGSTPAASAGSYPTGEGVRLMSG